MMKYEKPKLVDIDVLSKTAGVGISSPDCAYGAVNVDVCPGGQVVTGGCAAGGVPSIECGGGGGV
jgi:hypothetical protein